MGIIEKKTCVLLTYNKIWDKIKDYDDEIYFNEHLNLISI